VPLKERENSIVVCISPLTAIMIEQQRKFGIRAEFMENHRQMQMLSTGRSSAIVHQPRESLEQLKVLIDAIIP